MVCVSLRFHHPRLTRLYYRYFRYGDPTSPYLHASNLLNPGFRLSGGPQVPLKGFRLTTEYGFTVLTTLLLPNSNH